MVSFSILLSDVCISTIPKQSASWDEPLIPTPEKNCPQHSFDRQQWVFCVHTMLSCCLEDKLSLSEVSWQCLSVLLFAYLLLRPKAKQLGPPACTALQLHQINGWRGHLFILWEEKNWLPVSKSAKLENKNSQIEYLCTQGDLRLAVQHNKTLNPFHYNRRLTLWDNIILDILLPCNYRPKFHTMRVRKGLLNDPHQTPLRFNCWLSAHTGVSVKHPGAMEAGLENILMITYLFLL